MTRSINGEAIDAVLAAAVERGAVPHVAAIVADADGVFYEGGAGVRVQGESEDPVTTSTQFRIMSMTKMVATTCALQQKERGELDFAAPIEEYVPEWADVQVLDGWDGDTPTAGPGDEGDGAPARHPHHGPGLLVLERGSGPVRGRHRHTTLSRDPWTPSRCP